MNLVETVRDFLISRGASAYFVGGTVRDVLLGRETHDIDVSVRGDASALARSFADEIGAAFFIMDQAFDVARAIFENDGTRLEVDFARLRGATIQDDLATRDFTVNAMATDAALGNFSVNAVVDPFHGLDDIAAHRLRAVSDAVFVNDPVRLLRAVRFEAELGLALDKESEAQVRRDAALIKNAPGERARDELMRILAANDARRQLHRLDDLDLLGRLLPEVVAVRGITQSPPHIYDVFEHSLHAVTEGEDTERAGYLNIAQGAFGEQLRLHFAGRTLGRSRSELMRLALLLHDIGKPNTRMVEPDGRIRFLRHEDVGADMAENILRRLRFSNGEIGLVKTIVAHHLRPILLAQNGISDRAVYRFFRDLGEVGVDVAVHAWCDQRATYGDAMPPEIDAKLQAVIGRLLDRYYHAHTQVVAPPPLLKGTDVMEHLHLKPGPRVGSVLDALREAQAIGQVLTREDALAFLQNFDMPD